MDIEKTELIACLSCAREYYKKAEQFVKVLEEKYPDEEPTGDIYWRLWDWVIEGYTESEINKALIKLKKQKGV